MVLINFILATPAPTAPVTLPPSTSASVPDNILSPGASLGVGDMKFSPSYQYYMILQEDNTFVVTDGAEILWSSAPATGDRVTMGENGQLTLTLGGSITWSQTGAPGAHLIIKDDGVAYLESEGGSYWQSNTQGKCNQ